MRYRTFGRTGLQISELVFGGGWVGGVLIHQDDDTKLKVLRHAIDSGINWIDTASKYGDGKSEEALGWLLPELSQRPYVSTKVMLDTANLDDIAGQVERSTHESLSRMKLDSVDLLQLHNPLGVEAVDPNASGHAITAEHVLAKNGVADSLDRMREQGLTKHMGFTALGDAASCRRLIDSDRFDSAQVYYNALGGLQTPEHGYYGYSRVRRWCARQRRAPRARGRHRPRFRSRQRVTACRGRVFRIGQ
jgi:L-galactose dehydrogenase/L-glyceraldehyde 3-phosphate reductase